ncbi:MAG: DivIVA domain-containing protein [Propionibacteriaceae bacterium]|jgi:DivIVA domain-containing protein|nr:DivIVA domain-containing protein [Propionibacteriaceae bacterium]
MTMTLDEVRKTRFHMTRRQGYEVTDVDIFVDKVEETLQGLTAENENLRRQLSEAAPQAGGNDLEVEDLRFQLGRLQEDRNGLKSQVLRLQADLDQARARAQSAPTAGAPNEAMAREIDQLRAQLAEARGQMADAQRNGVGQDQLMRLTGENRQLREQLDRMVTTADRSSADVMPVAVTTSPEASSAVVRLVQLATEQADNLVSEATAEATRRKGAVEDELKNMREQADSYVNRVKTEADSHATQVKSEAQFSAEEMLRKATDSSAQMTQEAQEKAERMDHDARTNAERLVHEAQQRAATIDSEIAARRTEVFGALETERDVLFAKVEKLRTYEKSFRQTMTGYLKSQIERLDASQFSPDEVPDLLQTPARTASDWNADTTSSTPRLDALLEG